MRGFRLFKNMKFADDLLKADKLVKQMQTFSPELCSKECVDATGCHSFLINKGKGCVLLSTSPSIDRSIPVVSYEDDLYISSRL